MNASRWTPTAAPVPLSVDEEIKTLKNDLARWLLSRFDTKTWWNVALTTLIAQAVLGRASDLLKEVVKWLFGFAWEGLKCLASPCVGCVALCADGCCRVLGRADQVATVSSHDLELNERAPINRPPPDRESRGETGVLGLSDWTSIESMMRSHKPSFAEVRTELGWDNRRVHAGCVAFSRLVFWHWAQPVAFAGTFWRFHSQLDRFQVVTAMIVLARELLYFFCTAILAWQNAAFLLTRPFRAIERDVWGIPRLLFFVLMPEKFVLTAMQSSASVLVCFVASTFMDLWSLIGLLVGIHHGNLPLPMMISFAITSTAGVLFCAAIFLPTLLTLFVHNCILPRH